MGHWIHRARWERRRDPVVRRRCTWACGIGGGAILNSFSYSMAPIPTWAAAAATSIVAAITQKLTIAAVATMTATSETATRATSQTKNTISISISISNNSSRKISSKSSNHVENSRSKQRQHLLLPQAATDLVDPVNGKEDEESPERLRPNRVAGGRGGIQVEELEATALLGPVGKRKQPLVSHQKISNN